MLHGTIWRYMRTAALAATVSLAFGSMAWAHDDDDYNRRDEAREQGYRNGYNEGVRAGQYDSDRGRRFHFKNDDWEDAHGFQHWMGNHGHYKKAYRKGYEQGYRRGFNYYANGRDRDRDGHHRHRDRDTYRGYDQDGWR